MHLWPPLLLTLSTFAFSSNTQAPEQPPSTLSAPVQVDLSSLLDAAERATPRVPPGVETWTNLPGPALGGGTFRYNLYRDALVFALNGNHLEVHTTVNYWLEMGLRMKGWIKGMGSCGRAPESYRRAQLGLMADVGLTPDWHIDLKLTPEDPVRIDSCQVTLVGYDITDKVLAAMKDSIYKAANGMEQQLKANGLLRQKVESAWLQAQQPVELTPGVFMMMNPEKVGLAPLRSTGRTLILTPQIQIRPTLTLGPPPQAALRPLPALDQTQAPAQPGFRLRVQADLTYEQATAQLARQMVGQHFDTEKGSFEVQSVAVRASGGNALLELGLKGRVNGKLTLTGHPRFDPQLGAIRLDGLDYTLESKSWITRLGEWLYRSSLRKTLSEKCNLFMDKKFQDLKNQAQQGLNRNLTPDLAMTGTLQDLSLDQIQVLDDRFSVVAVLNGQVQLNWKAGH